MTKWNKAEFKKLNKQKKYELLKKEGTFVGNRIYGSHQCSLFIFSGMYVEIWRAIGLNYIQWIELVESSQTLEEYVDNLRNFEL